MKARKGKYFLAGSRGRSALQENIAWSFTLLWEKQNKVQKAQKREDGKRGTHEVPLIL